MRKNYLKYPVEFADDVFGESEVLSDMLRQVTGAAEPRVLLVADLNVVQRHEGLGTRIGRYVQDHAIGLAGRPVVIAGGEKIKADEFQSVSQVAGAALGAGLAEGGCMLVLGGGALLDVAGYAAAQLGGGVPVVRLPTSPAAMMAAAFAERAAVDLGGVKDALSVPAPPAAVLIDCAFASTVLDGVWRGGVGEAARLAVANAELRELLSARAEPYRAREPKALAEIVRLAVAVRRKSGEPEIAGALARRLEAMSEFRLPHGYAVPIALSVELRCRREAGSVKPEVCEELLRFLSACGALDGLNHSRHLLGRADELVAELDGAYDPEVVRKSLSEAVSLPA